MNYDEIMRCNCEPSQQELDEDRYDDLPTVDDPEIDAIFDKLLLIEAHDFVWDDKLWQWVPKLEMTGEVYDSRIDGLV